VNEPPGYAAARIIFEDELGAVADASKVHRAGELVEPVQRIVGERIAGRGDQQVLRAVAVAGSADRGDIALRIVADAVVPASDPVQPVRARARAPRAVLGPGIGVVRAAVRDDLARRVVAEAERQVVGRPKRSPGER
jgi:hypothetical protein